MPWQSHPFTIASIPSDSTSGEQEMVVLVRSAKGITKRLLKHVSSSSSSSLPLFLDGPYGGIRTNLAQFEHVVLVAGGTGVTFILPVLQDLVRRMRKAEQAKQGEQEGTSDMVCKSVQVVWSVREKECISWVLPDLQKVIADAPASSVSIKVHVTRGGPGQKDIESSSGSSSQDIDEKQSVDDEKKEAAALSYPWFGRPNLRGGDRGGGEAGEDLGYSW
ncbi:hypothetical protein NLJ89_g9142 [Agrocybe chaxingu]|uniref:Ferric reductase NAD binding domain-containing protein n=1 Tax=Agrocybe chaxingu TaxID=84603 RepID=A0A9W8MTE7_9AGAR|nr:hypothetical protein NLJ89_g9142 [Agrocybe chaxingu]